MKKSNFSKSQEAKVNKRLHLVNEYLLFLGSTRAKFPHATALAKAIAHYVTTREKLEAPAAYQTFLRPPYRAPIFTHMATPSKKGILSIRSSEIQDETAKAVIATLELEAANLRRETVRLRAYIDSLEQSASSGPLLTDSSRITEMQDRVNLLHLQFARTCQSLLTIVSRFKDVLVIDKGSRTIQDMSLLRNKVILKPDMIGPFFDWLEKTQNETRE